MRPFSAACERNREPILAVLARVFADRTAVLEIGAGTGQHAAYFAPALPHLTWQPTDVAEHLAGIRMWTDAARAPNLHPPIALDVDDPWPEVKADAAFSANTCHIMSWSQVEKMFDGIARLLPSGGVFALYGPFKYAGRYTSESNERFDAMLRADDARSGLRDMAAVLSLAGRCALVLEEDNAMPANNRLLVFRKRSSPHSA